MREGLTLEDLMRTARTWRIALAVAALACEGGPIAPVVPGLGSLATSAASFAPGDRIELDVRLQGCFHDQRLVVSLLIDADSAIVERFKATGNLAPGYRFQPATTLSARQLAGLGHLIEEHHRPSNGRCTSSERGHVRIVREGKTVRREEFNDASCRWFDGPEPAFHWFMLADIVQATDVTPIDAAG